jgi:hypothetical protein
MPIKLTPEILSAALAGFEEQKNRIDAQIVGLRQIFDGASTAPHPRPPNPDAKCLPPPGRG